MSPVFWILAVLVVIGLGAAVLVCAALTFAESHEESPS